jgi:SpoVK/Ycf46/Vps4 family AAA+-type ATPase
MALTYEQLLLIRAISENDFDGARKVALRCLAEDTSQKNRASVERLTGILLTKTLTPLSSLSTKVKEMVIEEDLSKTFNVNRYYLSKREEKLAKEIITACEVCEKMRELGVDYLNTTLIYGKSGTGKTSFGRYIASELNIPYIYVNFTGLIDSYMGSTAKNLEKVFKEIKYERCVIMLDEIDSIAVKRGGDNNGAMAEMNRVTIALMQEFDRLPNSAVVIAATNREDFLDEAVVRRFNRKQEILELNRDEAIEMTLKYLKDIKYNLENPGEVFKDEEGKYNQSNLLSKIKAGLAEAISNGVTTIKVSI